MTYQEVFGGSNIYPADVTYLALALTAPIDLDWPMESAAPPYPMARIIDVIGNGPHKIRLPDATQGSVGAITLFNLLTASSGPCFVTDHAGATIATLGVGEQWEIYLTSNATAAGVWRVFRFGASTATVQPSALAGYGLTVTGSTLSQSVPVTTFTASPRSVLASDRASALVWTGAGTGVLNLPGVSTVGNNFFVSARNAGGGMLTLDPNGSEVIDGGATVALTPGEGVVLVTDGLVWYTLGRGQAAIFAFDFTAISLAGSGPTYTLTGAELNRIAYKFTGVLTTNVTVIVPSTFQQYWVDNSTTGAFTLSLNTASGVAVGVAQGSRGIFYCDGAKVVDADTGGISVPISASDGGTGQISYTIGDLLSATGPTTLARLADVAVGNVLLSKGVGVVPAYGKVDLTTTVVGALPPANGGTGGGTYAVGDLLVGAAGNTLGRLATAAAGNVLRSGASPSWGKVDLATDVVGSLPPANGGSGGGAIAQGSVVFASVGGLLAGDPAFQWNNTTKALTVTGALNVNGQIATLGASVGNASINTGGAGNSGLISFYRPSDQARHGYIGFASNPNGYINYANDFGGGHVFSGGNVGIGKTPTVALDVVGAITASGAINAGGNVGGADFFSYRAGVPTTGIIFLGNANTHYLHWDGTNYVMPNGNLLVNGAQVLTSIPALPYLSNAMDAMVGDAGGNARFYFATGGTTYHISPTGHNFRVSGAGGPDVMSLATNGNLGISGSFNAGGNIDATSGTVTAINTTATGQAYGASVVSGGGGVNLSANNTPLQFADASGTKPKFVCQNDNNFVFYGTDAAGGLRPIYGIGMRHNTAGVSFNVGITVNGDITATGNITAFSDARLKTNVETIEDALDKVEEMRGVTFERTDTGAFSSGVIAQELEEVAPELVHTNEDGMKSVAYGNLVGYLIEAIKELRIEVAQLRVDAGL